MGTLRQIMKIKPSKGTEKLPKRFKEKWIEALRGGRYEQAKGTLLRVRPEEGTNNEIEVGYCCLGVAAHVCEVGREHLIGRGNLLTNSDTNWNHILNRIPKVLRKNKDLLEIFIDFNDGYKYNKKEGRISFNFNQIAAWIEKYL